MVAALKDTKEGMGIREAARLYNLPFETLRRRVKDEVGIDCRSGPSTALTEVEEEQLAAYCIKMADMGFGLARTDVMQIAFKIAESSGRSHPFTKDTAGRAWFDGFRSRHPRLTLRSAQSLSHSRAYSASKETVSDYFAKLGAVCAKLNLLTKPMQVYNMDETGVSIVHKPGRVLTQLGRRNVWAITSAEKGKTHTILACVSASGNALPPFMIYPRKRMPDYLKVGAVPGTAFHCSDSGWVNSELFYKWLEFFIKSIPPSRPVLLLLDGHASHVSIEVIELARSNDIHMLCLPAHTTHILQPLDVGVFKSLKSNYYKACKKYITDHPGRVITTDVIAALVAVAWPQSVTPVNIMAGFKKCGAYPLNPGEVTDRQIAPSNIFRTEKEVSLSQTKSTSTEEMKAAANGSDISVTPPSSDDRESLFKKRFEEGYDIFDEEYVTWLRCNHPKSVPKSLATGGNGGISSSCSGSSQPRSASCKSVCSTHCGSATTTTTTSTLSDILSLPKPKTPRRKRQGLNAKAKCVTDIEVLEQLKEKGKEKERKEEEKRARQLEKERKKQEKQEKKKTRQLDKEHKKSAAQKKKQTVKAKTTVVCTRSRMKQLNEQLQSLTTADSGSESESEAECPKCGLVYGCPDDDEMWVQCDNCGLWWDLTCTELSDEENIPDTFICARCVKD